MILYIFCCKCDLLDTSDPEIFFFSVLTMPGYGLSQHSKAQQSHFTDFHNMWL